MTLMVFFDSIFGMQKEKTFKLNKFFKGVWLVLLAILLVALLFLVSLIYVFEKGPSPELRDIFVVTVMQSSAAKPLARLFLTQEEVDAIMTANSAADDIIISDTDSIIIDKDSMSDEVKVIDIYGPAYNGKMMIIRDPSRVYVYTLPDYSASHGMYLTEMVEAEGAIGGVNGGGFYDGGGLGDGTAPYGFVFSNGVCRRGMYEYWDMAGFDSNNKLVVGNMSYYEAVNRGIRDALTWGPALIINGYPVDVGYGGGLNPRTAIGQTADGTVLLLVIDGRQPSSIGASYNDLIGIFLEYGAVNAYNLDGGNSAGMVYNGEIVNNMASIAGQRYIPTAVLVK